MKVKSITKNKYNSKRKYKKPEVIKVGSAKELINGLSELWDSKTSVTPTDIHDATAS